ncbi:MAG: serine protease [Deltaproteobacteria bacterium]|nr:serine protease [Deltaproteobacteria bacterium]
MNHRVFRTVLFGLVIVFALAACSSGPGSSPQGPQAPQEPPDDPGGQPLTWADVLRESQVEKAVYGLGFYLPDGRNYIVGTGFAAYYTNALWTNAHVADGLLEVLNAIAHLQPVAIAVQSGSVVGGAGTYLLTRYDVHPEYDGTPGSPDLASVDIYIDGELPVVLDLLPREFTSQLEVGEPIATMGFPGEISNPYTAAPIATFKEGTISALRPFSNVAPTPENTTLVQHNLGTTGGTSGSPIIDGYGLVIAVNHAGTEVLVYDQRTGQPQRVTTGALGFGIRADEVWTMVAICSKHHPGPPPGVSLHPKGPLSTATKRSQRTGTARRLCRPPRRNRIANVLHGERGDPR